MSKAAKFRKILVSYIDVWYNIDILEMCVPYVGSIYIFWSLCYSDEN